MGRKILALFAMALLIITCVNTVAAEEFDPGKTGSVSVTLVEREEKTPIEGAELSVYHIATVGINMDGNLNYSFTEEYADLGIAMDDPALAAKLDAYLSENEMPAIRFRTASSCQRLPSPRYSRATVHRSSPPTVT